MRLIRWGFWITFFGAIAAGVYLGAPRARAWWKERTKPRFQTVEVGTGNVIYEINASGKVDPIYKVTIGSFVSGPIIELHADYNSVVKKGELLAKIDPRLYLAGYERDMAALEIAKAEVKRAEALLMQAERDLKRAQMLKEENPDYVSGTEMDQFRFSRDSLAAQLEIAKANVLQADGNVKNSKTNLDYTSISAPIDGIIIERKIDEGNTVASSFQTPELFIMAPEMDKRMWIFADVLEADIGEVRKAQTNNKPVSFEVDAYDDEVFTGQIKQIRLSSKEDTSVVSYPVVVEAPNPDMKLMPGLTANLTFEIERRENVVRIPTSAIIFLPNEKHVREQDKRLVLGLGEAKNKKDDASPTDKEASKGKRNKRHVWMQEGDLLKAVEVELGIDDRRYYELLSNNIKVGDKLVTGLETGRPSR